MPTPPTTTSSIAPASAEELARVHEALRQSEASRRESQAFFEKSFQANPALMAISGAADGRIIEVNPALIRASGFTREEIIGRTSQELGFWCRPGQRDEFFRGLMAQGAVRDVEADFRTRTGELRSLLVNADRIELGGQPCLLTVAVDVTERRRRERIQSSIYEIAQAVLAGRDLPALFAELHRIVGTLIPAHNFYVALLSPDRSRLSFPYFVDERATAPAPREMAAGLTEYVIDTARPLRTSAAETTVFVHAGRHYQPTGNPSALWLGAPLVIDGRAIGVITVQDYHDPAAYTDADLQLLMFVADQAAVAVQRGQAELALARAEKRYRSIFENAVEGMYVSTPAGRFVSANRALAAMFGYTSPAALVATVCDITRIYVRPERRDEFFRLVQTCDEISDFESEVCRRDGSTFWISESVRVIRHSDGRIDHFEGVAIDITERHAAARALRAAKEEADAASRAKSHFLASVSHELRTPLNGILGYTQILGRDTALAERQRQGVRVIHESAEHLLTLINEILDFSKVEAGRIELHASDFDLVEFAAGIERVFTPRARENGLLFETALGADLPRWVRGDEHRLRQIVFNLVSNAVKFTREGGVVLSIHPAGRGVVAFAVSDTGIGIAAADQAKLFEPFAQVGNKSWAAATGTGLGLAISRSLVELMGGRLQVESTVGRGSRFGFEIALPAAAATARAMPAAPRHLLGYEGRRRRVLVVDDNATNRGVLMDMLAPLGFDLSEAEDGRAALAAIDRLNPDLVLMDLRLPGGMSGIDAVRALRARAPSPSRDARRPGVIAVSASAFAADRDECFAAGCDEFLAKPFRYEELAAAIERVLGLKWRQTETGDTAAPFPSVVEAPDAAEVAAIHELAAKGDVVAIRERAQALLAQDPKFAPFARGVLELATRFRMKAIRHFVGRYMR